jgi:hypothetical protein
MGEFMTGNKEPRGDIGGTVSSDPDPCDKKYSGAINSPKQAVLAGSKAGDVLDVSVDQSGTRPILIVQKNGQTAGSLTFVGYLDVIGCIIDRGRKYKATLTKILNGHHDVRVEPK